MVTFIPAVERWRALVTDNVKAELMRNASAAVVAGDKRLTVEGLADVVLAIINVESAGNPAAIGDDGKSIGLMQLNYDAGAPADVGYIGDKAGLFVPETNVRYGTRFFFKQLIRYRDVDKAVLAYNAGSVRTDAKGAPVNQSYLDKVLALLSIEKKKPEPDLLLEPLPPACYGFTLDAGKSSLAAELVTVGAVGFALALILILIFR